MLSRAPTDVHGTSPGRARERGRAGAIQCELEMIGAAEERAQLSRPGLGVGRNHARDVPAGNLNHDGIAACETGERTAVDVRDEIAKAINPDDLAVEGT